MYAVIKTGGKQYRVQQGTTLQIEKIEAETNSSVDFDQVLLIADGENVTVGAPLVSGAKVTGEVIAQGRGEKIKIVKFRRRKHYRNITGHRQYLTTVKITNIQA